MRSESKLIYFNLTDMFIYYKQCFDPDQGLLDPVLENTLSKYKKGWSCLESKADQLILVPKWCLA